VTVEVVYCAGWDAGTRSIVQPLPEAVARERDAAGEQYAIVYTGEHPLVLVEICWAAHHAAVWFFDARQRRDQLLEFRRWPDDRLRLRTARLWSYEPSSLEFRVDEPEWRRPYWRAVYEPDGSRSVSSGMWDGAGLEVPSLHPLPEFGEWTSIIGDLGPLAVRPDPDEVVPAVPPWQPPSPLRPRQLDDTFEKGARFELDDGAEVTVELAPGGVLRMPSGQLIAGDPDPWLHEIVPFLETVEPGEYPLQLSVVRFADAPDHTRVAACALWVSDRPTASWNNAWREGEHPLQLGDGEFYGVGVDAGRVALVDAALAPAYADIIEDAYDDMDGWAHTLPGPGDANLITVSSGWGDGAYPVWVGRDEAGELTCFVVDFLVLAAAKRLD
jgi:hypothetical protein